MKFIDIYLISTIWFVLGLLFLQDPKESKSFLTTKEQMAKYYIDRFYYIVLMGPGAWLTVILYYLCVFVGFCGKHINNLLVYLLLKIL